MFSKICGDVGLLRRRLRFRCCLILDNEMFSDIASTSRHEGQTADAKSKKLAAIKRRLSAFLSY